MKTHDAHQSDEPPQKMPEVKKQAVIINHGPVTGCFQGSTTIVNFYGERTDTVNSFETEASTYEPLTTHLRSQSRHLNLKQLLTNTFTSPHFNTPKS